MKRINYVMLLIFTATTFLFNGCSSDDDGGDGGNAPAGTIRAQIDGSSFTSLEITTFANITTGGGQTTLVLQGNTTTQAINILINGYDGVGTYQFSDNNVFRVASYIEPNVSNPLNSQTWTAPYENSGIVGELNVAEQTDTNIRGTFNFTARNSNDASLKSITNGQFNISLTNN